MMAHAKPEIIAILKQYDINPAEALWDCHGTWVIYHRFCEIIAVKAGISFDPPFVVENRGLEKSVAIVVTGSINGGRSEWSVGEASPGNNKNSYPYAMAEKRAKDRVILKLVGLSGFVYSEEEADDFKDSRPQAPAQEAPRPTAPAKNGQAPSRREPWASGPPPGHPASDPFA